MRWTVPSTARFVDINNFILKRKKCQYEFHCSLHSSSISQIVFPRSICQNSFSVCQNSFYKFLHFPNCLRTESGSEGARSQEAGQKAGRWFIIIFRLTIIFFIFMFTIIIIIITTIINTWTRKTLSWKLLCRPTPTRSSRLPWLRESAGYLDGDDVHDDGDDAHDDDHVEDDGDNDDAGESHLIIFPDNW